MKTLKKKREKKTRENRKSFRLKMKIVQKKLIKPATPQGSRNIPTTMCEL